MHSTIEQQLKARMESKSLSPAALEKKAGLKRGVISNILRGSSKNPSSDTLVAIANTLDCSLDDLVNRTPTLKKQPSIFSLEGDAHDPLSHLSWEPDLYLQTASAIVAAIKDKNIKVCANKAMFLMKEVYQYSLSKEKNEVDRNFAEWLVSKL